MANNPIYLDFNATTPVDPRVTEEITQWLRDGFGNPSSGHVFGMAARQGVLDGRERLAARIGAEPDEIIFTGGGSESNNLAIKGVAFAHMHQGRHIVTSQIEHPAVLRPCEYLRERFGFSITYVSVNRQGIVDPDEVADAVREDTILVSIMHSNNETGVIQPIREIAERIRGKRPVYFHTDASQSIGKVPVHVNDLGVDLLTVAGHKFYAPKGIGALYIRRGTPLDALVHGAGHEKGIRAGTENVAYIAGLGKAADLCDPVLHGRHMHDMAARLWSKLSETITGLQRNGHPERCLPNTLNISFPGIRARELLAELPHIALSTGSACHSGEDFPSPVLMAMGLGKERALSAVRISVGRFTTPEEVDRAAAEIASAYHKLTGNGRDQHA